MGPRLRACTLALICCLPLWAPVAGPEMFGAASAGGRRPTASSPAAAPAKVSYETAFLDLYIRIGLRYPCFKTKGIDWKAVGRELLPRVRKVKTEGPKKGQTGTFKLTATLAPGYLPRLRVPIKGIADSKNVSWKMLDGKIGHIYVRRIRRDLIGSLDRAVKELAGAKGLIVDVRGNSGGGFDSRRSHLNFALGDPAEAERPRYKRPIALLIDERCISAGEGWASWFIARKRARVFGTATAGASARKEIYVLKNGLYKVRFPVKHYRGFLRRPIERRGLEPHVPLRQTAQDLAAGRDTVLEAARQYLLKAK